MSKKLSDLSKQIKLEAAAKAAAASGTTSGSEVVILPVPGPTPETPAEDITPVPTDPDRGEGDKTGDSEAEHPEDTTPEDKPDSGDSEEHEPTPGGDGSTTPDETPATDDKAVLLEKKKADLLVVQNTYEDQEKEVKDLEDKKAEWVQKKENATTAADKLAFAKEATSLTNMIIEKNQAKFETSKEISKLNSEIVEIENEIASDSSIEKRMLSEDDHHDGTLYDLDGGNSASLHSSDTHIDETH